jgi:hypothetical protein
MELDKHIIDKINDAHEGVVQSSKDAIQYAIMAGAELSRIKSLVEHGEFIPILNSGKFKFGERTARRYMQVADYSAKTTQLSDLQEAYKLIESEESKKKQAEQADQRQRIQYRIEHNEKPNTWQRSDDYAWKKHQEEAQARSQRIKDFQESQLNISATDKDTSELDEDLNRAKEKASGSADFINDYLKNEQSKLADMQNLKITNQNGGILQLVESYLAGLGSDSQRIEECYNIIKYCKDKAIKLQQK